MRRLTALLVLAAALAAGCGGDGGTTAATPTATASAAEEPVAPEPSSDGGGGGAPFVASLAVDPGDGTVLAGTGLGLYRIAPGARRGKPFEGDLRTPVAAGAISPNLVLRFTGPGELLGSGHPKDSTSGLPEYLGLIRSEDGGELWDTVSLLGEEDLHALDARGDVVAGHPVDEKKLLVSGDGGRSFEDRTPPDMPIDVDLDPADPQRIALTTAEGFFVSRDGGGSWRQRDVLTVETLLAWSPKGPLYRVDASGAVKASDDGGESWTDTGNAGGGPTAFTVDEDGALYVALAGGVITRSQDGGKSFSELARLTAG